jgi:carbon storage regulator CsrA
MLVLTRKVAQKVYIGTDICVTVVKLDGGQVRLGIEAPREIPVMRAELISVLRGHPEPFSVTTGHAQPPSAASRHAQPLAQISEPGEPLTGSPGQVERIVLEAIEAASAAARPNSSHGPGRTDVFRPLPRLIHGIGIRSRRQRA